MSPIASTSSLPIPSLIHPPPPPSARKVRPCACCKLRRVSCKRSSGSLDACDWCLARGLQCVTDTTPYTRKGKRIEAAKSKYGTLLPIRRTEATLAAQEMDLSLAYHLVEIYVDGGYDKRDAPHLILPLTSWTQFKQDFENAGRNPANMSGAYEAMSYIIFANAARVSRHPAVTGLLTSPDSEAGSRDHAYRALIERAITVCDEKGIWRSEVEDASVGMIVMLLMHYLVCDGELGNKKARHYKKSAFDLFRLIWSEAQDERREFAGEFDPFAWPAMILDAFSSAETGTAPQLTSSEILSYIGPFPAFLITPSPTSDFYVLPTESGAGQKFWQSWLGALKYVVDLARATSAWKRSKGGGRVEDVMQIWRGVNEVVEWSKATTKAREDLAKHLWDFSELYTGMIWGCCANLCSIIRDHLTLLLSSADLDQFGTTTSGGDDLMAWITLSALAEQRAKESITDYIYGTKNERQIYILAVITGTMFSVSRLEMMARDFIDHLSTDGRSFAEKASGLKFFYKLLIRSSLSYTALNSITADMLGQLLLYDDENGSELQWDEQLIEETDELTKEKVRTMLRWDMHGSLTFI